MTRPRIDFWLNTNKPDELWLLQQITHLKANNLFSRFVRDGLTLAIQLHGWALDARSVYRLLADLRDGNTDLLFAMFPHIRATLERGGGNGFIGREEVPALRSPLPELPQVVVQTAPPDLAVMGEEFLDFIS